MNSYDVRIEKPRLCVPASLIVDDPAPCINPFYYYRLQVEREGSERHEQHIPLDFLAQFAAVCRAQGVRGKFSVLPYPAGLGSILDGWPGCDRDELRAWLELARTAIEPDFDITPEILTHTRALDLASGQLLEQSEHEWLSERSEAELKEYFDAALRLLREAGFAPAGITQPVAFNGARDDYARATLGAIHDAGGPPVTYYFVDGLFDPPPLPEPRAVLLDRERGEAVVDIMALCNDYFWPTQRVTRQRAEQVADRVLSPDGSAGRLAELAAADAWLLWVCHWQTLYSDGAREGLRALELVAARLRRAHGARLAWLKLSEVALYRAASEACVIRVSGDGGTVAIELESAFDCPDWTISMPWPAQGTPRAELAVEGQGGLHALATDERHAELMAPASWRRADGRLCLCFDLRRGRQTITIGNQA